MKIQNVVACSEMNLIWRVNDEILMFEDWLVENNDELNCIFAETGADRELCFNYEERAEEIYNTASWWISAKEYWRGA